MLNLQIILPFVLFMKLIWCSPQTKEESDDELTASDVINICALNEGQRNFPQPVDDLIDQCEPWRENSCCSAETASKINKFKLYNLELKMCPNNTMSEGCKKYIKRHRCFFECSPNAMPWKVKSNILKFLNIPLCNLDCEQWFKECANDYTCEKNWIKFYLNSEGIPTFPDDICGGKKCVKIKDLFSHSTSFCENIFDFAWHVVGDNEPCMQTMFQPDRNPNDKVAYKYAMRTYRHTRKMNLDDMEAVSSTLQIPNIFIISFPLLCLLILV